MHDEPRVWIRKRKLKGGRTSYHLRWLDTGTQKWRSRRIGTDCKRAEREAAGLEKELAEGTFSDLRRISWADFAQEHASTFPGKDWAYKVRFVLAEFGEVCGPTTPASVRYAMAETYQAFLRTKGNSVRTRNEKQKLVRGALDRAIRRGYLIRNPLDGFPLERSDERIPRALSAEEITRLLDACPSFQWRVLLRAALDTGCRRNELLTLKWADVHMDGEPHIVLTSTKGKRDRVQPLTPEAADALRRLQPSTLREEGPFRGMGSPHAVTMRFVRLARRAGVRDCSLKSLRSTYLTDCCRAGVSLVVAAKLAGHSNPATTARYYIAVSDQEKAEAVAKLANRVG